MNDELITRAKAASILGIERRQLGDFCRIRNIEFIGQGNGARLLRSEVVKYRNAGNAILSKDKKRLNRIRLESRKRFAKWLCKNHQDWVPPMIKVTRDTHPGLHWFDYYGRVCCYIHYGTSSYTDRHNEKYSHGYVRAFVSRDHLSTYYSPDEWGLPSHHQQYLNREYKDWYYSGKRKGKQKLWEKDRQQEMIERKRMQCPAIKKQVPTDAKHFFAALAMAGAIGGEA